MMIRTVHDKSHSLLLYIIKFKLLNSPSHRTIAHHRYITILINIYAVIDRIVRWNPTEIKFNDML